MGHYKSNVRDLEFNLFEMLALEKVLATGAFGDLDGESVRQMLDEAAKMAEGPLAEAFAETDRHPPTFDPAAHTVSIPEPFKKAFRAWYDGGDWFRVGMAANIGGGCPRLRRWSGRSTSSRSALSRPPSSTRPARRWPTSSTRSATSSNGTGRR